MAMDKAEKRKIEAIERQITEERPWQLRGEVAGIHRPVNSLLFEEVRYEQRLKAPEITPETTETLEEMIKQRIKDNKFDDPVRKVRPSALEAGTSTEIEVSAEKSKIGLAQLYEQDLITRTGNTQIRDGPEKEVERRLVALCRKLDALCER